MFEHSVPVPRKYKLASKILQKVKEEGQNLKSLLYEEKNRFFPVQAVHALTVEALKRDSKINELLLKSKLLFHENKFDPWLARILITEILWGKQVLPGESKPEKTIVQYQRTFESILESAGSSESVGNDPAKETIQPKYIRINTLKIAAADAVRHYQDEGWNLVRCTSKSYDDYLKQVENLADDEFLPDFHVKVVFTFPPSAKFHCDELYNNYDVLIQNKATCLASFILAPTPGSTVLDMCAAPGMKTTHLAAIMKNEGTVYAVEQNIERYELLCDFVESSGSTCVKPIHGDAIKINKSRCPNVDYVLLDPSCSGSGIIRAEGNDTTFDLQSGRVSKLASFQAKLLRHALNEFRSAKRVVYSTCSIYSEENEAVVQDVINSHKGNFKLVSAKEKLNNNWNNVGDPKFIDIGEKCLYARPSSDHTCGFFIAVFERAEVDDAGAKETKEVLGNNDVIKTDLSTLNVAAVSDLKINNSNKKKLNFDNKKDQDAGDNVIGEVKNYGAEELGIKLKMKKKKSHKKNKVSKKEKIVIDDSNNKVKKVNEKKKRELVTFLNEELDERKHTKRKYSELINGDNDIEHSNSEDIIESTIETKKSRQNKRQKTTDEDINNGISEISEDQPNGEQLNDDVIPSEVKVKKSKKKKISKEDHAEVYFMQKDCKDSSKRKNTKKTKIDSTDIKSTQKNKIEECEAVKIRKGKQSKRENENFVKIVETEDSLITNEIEDDVEIVEIEEPLKKSKKKRNKSKVDKIVIIGKPINIEELRQESVASNKKLRNKSIVDDIVGTPTVAVEESSAKKSKKNKKCASALSTNDVSAIIDLVEKKKKNHELLLKDNDVTAKKSVEKKNKTYESVLIDNDLSEIVELVEKKKKNLKFLLTDNDAFAKKSVERKNKKYESALIDNDISEIVDLVEKKKKNHESILTDNDAPVVILSEKKNKKYESALTDNDEAVMIDSTEKKNKKRVSTLTDNDISAIIDLDEKKKKKHNINALVDNDVSAIIDLVEKKKTKKPRK